MPWRSHLDAVALILTLERWQHGLTSTLGSLFVDDKFLCFTLEDVVREVPELPVEEWKIKDQTAIPKGTYPVKLTFSNRFQKDMPQIVGVPGFTGIRIHPGNTDQDTSGCILVGEEFQEESVLKSRAAYDALMAILMPAFQSGEEVKLEII